MNKIIDIDDDMAAEYDFTKFPKGVRGKYFQRMREGYTVEIQLEDGTIEVHHYHPLENSIVLDRDVRAFFSDAESVNRTLRALIPLVPQTTQEGDESAEEVEELIPA